VATTIDTTSSGSAPKDSSSQKSAQFAMPTKINTAIAGTTSHDTQMRSAHAAISGGVINSRANTTGLRGPSAVKTESSQVAPGRAS